MVLQPQHDILAQRDHEVLDGVETVLGLARGRGRVRVRVRVRVRARARVCVSISI